VKVLNTTELKKRYGAKRESLRQFWEAGSRVIERLSFQCTNRPELT